MLSWEICYGKTLQDRKQFGRVRLCKFKKGLILERDESHTNN